MDLEDSHETFAQSHSTHDTTIQIILENSRMLPEEASDTAHRAELSSEHYLLHKAFLNLARERCQTEGLPPDSREALNMFEEASKTASSITSAYDGLPFRLEDRAKLTPDQVREKMALLIPRYVRNLVTYVKEKGRFGAPSSYLSLAVGDYVNGRLRSKEIDRVLLMALTQAEISDFLYEMFLTDPLTGRSRVERAAPRKVRKTAWNVSKLIFWVWVISASIFISPLAFHELPADLMRLVALSIGGFGTVLLLIVGGIAAIDVIEARPRERQSQQNILNMIDRMNGFYIEFQGSGPFSLSHFKKRVNELADEGVVWPSGLFVLLDDMESRGVRSF